MSTSSHSTHKKPHQHSLGKIYSTKRQPPTQLLLYPQSALIDHYTLDQLHPQNHQDKSIIIKFVGNQQANISAIISSLDSLNQAQNQILMQKHKTKIEIEFAQILRLFYNKIHKIRTQRDSLKNLIETNQNQHLASVNSLKKDIILLKEEIVCLKKQKQSLIQKLQNQSKKKLFFQRQNLILLEKQKISTISSPQNFNLFHDKLQHPTYLSQINQPSFGSQINQPTYLSHINQTGRDSPLLLESQTDEIYEKDQFSTLNSHNNALSVNINLSNKQKGVSNKQQDTKDWKILSQKLSADESKQLEKILKKYNLQPFQLQEILEEYSKELQSNGRGGNKQISKMERSSFSEAQNQNTRGVTGKVKKEIEKFLGIKN